MKLLAFYSSTVNGTTILPTLWKLSINYHSIVLLLIIFVILVILSVITLVVIKNKWIKKVFISRKWELLQLAIFCAKIRVHIWSKNWKYLIAFFIWKKIPFMAEFSDKYIEHLILNNLTCNFVYYFYIRVAELVIPIHSTELWFLTFFSLANLRVHSTLKPTWNGHFTRNIQIYGIWATNQLS